MECIAEANSVNDTQQYARMVNEFGKDWQAWARIRAGIAQGYATMRKDATIRKDSTGRGQSSF
jgi:hypothetical protein